LIVYINLIIYIYSGVEQMKIVFQYCTYKSEFQQGYMYWSASEGVSFGLNLWQEGMPRQMPQQTNKLKTQAHLQMSACNYQILMCLAGFGIHTHKTNWTALL
jgi:hypothetical protein